jgi:hypothetical protein
MTGGRILPPEPDGEPTPDGSDEHESAVGS